MMVVLTHLAHLAEIAVPKSFIFIFSDFGKGVYLFFIISAFSLMYSTEHRIDRENWAFEYFIKRFFRIAPLYYCVMVYVVLRPFFHSHILALDASLPALLMNLTFAFGFAPWVTVVWAGWTVGVEMLFYVFFPIFLLAIRSRSAAFMLLIFSIVVNYASRSTLDVQYKNGVPPDGYTWAYFSFPANLCYFAMGIFIFRVSCIVDKASLMMRWIIPVLTVGLFGALMFSATSIPVMHWNEESLIWGGGFAALCLWQGICPSRWCANRVFEYLGERSYSVYLLHPIVIILLKNHIQDLYLLLAHDLGAYAFFVCAAVLLVPLLVLAEATYWLIEVAGINMGKEINRRLRETMRIKFEYSRQPDNVNFPPK
jgi:peptidoglycan/LPS O-acetylase OafA/YrhL